MAQHPKTTAENPIPTQAILIVIYHKPCSALLGMLVPLEDVQTLIETVQAGCRCSFKQEQVMVNKEFSAGRFDCSAEGTVRLFCLVELCPYTSQRVQDCQVLFRGQRRTVC